MATPITAGDPIGDGGCRFPCAFRTLLAAAQVATVVLTWPLWTVRDSPPNVPLLAVPRIDAGLPLLAGIAAAWLLPRRGLALQAAILLWAIVSDQCRIQPHMLSMLCLACGTIPGSRGGVLVARGSLVALWFFSGVHKLTSPAFFSGTMPALLSALGLPWGARASLACGAAIGGGEIALAVACILPATRRAVPAAACCVHSLIVLVLSPWGLDWNPEVVPWNVVLAFAGFALVAPWRDPLPGAAWRLAGRPARVAAVLLLLGPVGYWLGLVDAYLAHCLYSNDAPRAFICTPFGRRDLQLVCHAAGVQVPPAHRLFEPIFLGVGRPGEWLEVEDPRWIAAWCGRSRRTILGPEPAATDPRTRDGARGAGP